MKRLNFENVIYGGEVLTVSLRNPCFHCITIKFYQSPANIENKILNSV